MCLWLETTFLSYIEEIHPNVKQQVKQKNINSWRNEKRLQAGELDEAALATQSSLEPFSVFTVNLFQKSLTG